MKLQVTMKDPDTLFDAIDDKKRELTKQFIAEKGLTFAGAEAESIALLEKMEQFTATFFKYGEYLTIEFDDETQTTTVLKK